MIEVKSVKRNENLKPCPVCGLNAEIYDYVRDDGMAEGIGHVGCPRAIDRMHIVQCKSFIYSGKWHRTKKEAIGMWNEYVTLFNEMKGANK